MTQKKKILPESSLAERVTVSVSELRKTFQLVAHNYECRIDKELSEILGALNSNRSTKAKTATLRDMLALIRNLQVRPEKGRRKDLRKIDSLVGDLSMLIEDLRKAPPKPLKDSKPSKPARAAKDAKPPTAVASAKRVKRADTSNG